MDKPTMTQQEILDVVVRGIRAQGGPSVTATPPRGYVSSHPDTPFCAYRGANGRKCAAGHLIADADYRPKFEGRAPSSLGPGVLPNDPLVSELQVAHDNCAESTASDAEFLACFEVEVRKLAASFGLSVPK